MPDFNDIVITSTGIANFPDVDINGIFDDNLTLSGDPVFGNTNVTGSNAAIVVSTLVIGSIVSYGDTFNALSNLDGAIIGADEKIEFLGGNTQIIANSGEIDVPITLGSGQGLLVNDGFIGGSIRMGAGEDFLINQITDPESPDTFGLITGPVRMGSGNDVVQNASAMGRVFLGNGNDSYSVISPNYSADDFDAPDASAIIVRGGRGDDTIFGGAADDLFYGDANNDILNGHNGNDTLIGGQGKDTIRGGNDNDRLMGNQSKDNLFGGNGDDTLSGGNGEDRLIGGRGDDRLVGGSGADTFVFRGDSGSDTITDFNVSQDVIDLPDAFDAFGALYNDADVFRFLTYSDGNAILDLSALYKDINAFDGANIMSNADGIQIVFLDVAADSLTGDNFMTPGDGQIIEIGFL